MQSARIWFRQPHPPVTLATVKTDLNALGAQVEETELTLGTFTIPQLHVIQPVPFLIQLNNDEYVVEEAEEFAGFEEVPDEVRAKLSVCDARLEIGDVSENATTTNQGVVVIEGWTGFDPGQPKARELLKLLATEFNGVFEDNVNGIWWPL